ncbi:MAG: ImmA/IrrE family metallo-endopeptidase [Gemmataceae bacterium]|nr:ImmA/IrrE family metallo-endopeptidase [Gemmataceae bacterium]
MDFSQEDLFDACDRLVTGLLERAGVTAPPVDALRVAEDHLGIPVEWAEPEVDERGRPRPSARRHTGGITLSPHMTPEQQQQAAANGVARALLPDLLRKLDVEPGTESKQAAAHLRGLLAARILVPTKMLRSALRACKFDVPALQAVFETAAMEVVALRLLDLDTPCVIAVVDDGVVAVRRGNGVPVTRKLTPAEQAVADRVALLELPHSVRTGGWTAHGWPVPNRRFKRVILRAVPDDADV